MVTIMDTELIKECMDSIARVDHTQQPQYNAVRAWYALVNAAHTLGMPESYRSDLYVHDLTAIVHTDAATFVWGVYDYGTHIIMGEPKALDWFEACVKVYGDRIHWYTWDGETLSAITTNDARLFVMNRLQTV